MVADERPFCECGHCDATGRKGQGEVRLPMAAWAVAGPGDFDRIAVLPAHGQALIDWQAVEPCPQEYAVEKHRGWWALSLSEEKM